MPERQFITPIPGVKVYDMWEASLAVILKASVEIPGGQRCPRCQSAQWRIKAHAHRKLKHALWGGKLVVLQQDH